jgi:hypothetical protein
MDCVAVISNSVNVDNVPTFSFIKVGGMLLASVGSSEKMTGSSLRYRINMYESQSPLLADSAVGLSNYWCYISCTTELIEKVKARLRL